MPSFLSDDDIYVLKQVIADIKTTSKGKGHSAEKLFLPGDDQSPPEVYVAVTPSGGIPALTMAGATPAENDEPGYADCVIYQIIHSLPAAPALKRMDTADKTVYNLTSTDIAGDAWISIQKTKNGIWVPIIGGSSSIELSHGIVVRQCDAFCNSYVVRRIIRTMFTECPGTGT